MIKTIVGLFDKATEAKRAVEELRNSNFARDNVTITNGASDAAAMRMLQSGDIPEDDVQFYIEGVQHGGTLVVVRAADNHVRRATDILAKYDTIDTGNAELKSSSEHQADIRGFHALEPDFRAHYTTNYAQSGGNYDQYRTVYRYGYDLGADERTRASDWSSLEADARHIWEQRNPSTWDQFKASIQYAWDKTRRQQHDLHQKD